MKSVEELATSYLESKRCVGRPSKAQPFRAFIVELLTREPELRSLEIVQRARQAGYDGGKSALYSLIASVRPKKSRPLSGRDRVPGELSRHGFCSAEAQLRNGTRVTVHVFVSRLEYSGFTTASIVDDPDLEAVVRSMGCHFDSMGGVPLLAVFDSPRVVALSWDREGKVEEWQPAFAYAALEMGIGVEVRARRGTERGPGTNLANWLRQAFLDGRVFVDAADLERQLGAWLDELNATAPLEPGAPPPVVALAEERQRLRPLRASVDRPLRYPVVIGPRGIVMHEGLSCEMPPEASGLVGTLMVYDDHVRIVAGRYDVQHPRPRPRGPVRSLVTRWQPVVIDGVQSNDGPGRSAGPTSC